MSGSSFAEHLSFSSWSNPRTRRMIKGPRPLFLECSRVTAGELRTCTHEPKSQSLCGPDADLSMFSNFISLWVIPLSCRYLTALRGRIRRGRGEAGQNGVLTGQKYYQILMLNSYLRPRRTHFPYKTNVLSARNRDGLFRPLNCAQNFC